MQPTAEDRLSHLLRGMGLPIGKSSNFNPNKLEWLLFHIGDRNSNHKNYNEAMNLLKEMLPGKVTKRLKGAA